MSVGNIAIKMAFKIDKCFPFGVNKNESSFVTWIFCCNCSINLRYFSASSIRLIILPESLSNVWNKFLGPNGENKNILYLENIQYKRNVKTEMSKLPGFKFYIFNEKIWPDRWSTLLSSRHWTNQNHTWGFDWLFWSACSSALTHFCLSLVSGAWKYFSCWDSVSE